MTSAHLGFARHARASPHSTSPAWREHHSHHFTNEDAGARTGAETSGEGRTQTQGPGRHVCLPTVQRGGLCLGAGRLAPEARVVESRRPRMGGSHPGWGCHSERAAIRPRGPRGPRGACIYRKRHTAARPWVPGLSRGGGRGRDSTQKTLAQRPTKGRPGLTWPQPEVLSVGRADHHTLPDSGLAVHRHFRPKAESPEG